MKGLYTLLTVSGILMALAISCVETEKPKTEEEYKQKLAEDSTRRYEYKNTIKDLEYGMTSFQVDSALSQRPHTIICRSYFDGENCEWKFGGTTDWPDFILYFNNDTLVSKQWEERI